MVSASWCFYCAETGFGYAGRVLSDGLRDGEGLGRARGRAAGVRLFLGRLGLGKGLL